MKIRRINDIAIIATTGQLLGGDETDEVRETFGRLAAEGNLRLIVDLAGSPLMNSSALAVFDACRRDYERRGGHLVLCNVDRRIQRLLAVTRLSLCFHVAASEREAIEAIAQSA